MNRNRIIARIHALKRNLRLDDEIYHVILGSIAGKTSCRDLGDEELNLAMLAFERMASSGGAIGATSLVKVNQKQHRRIAKLGYILGWTWKDLAGFCKRQTGKRSTRACSATELNKIINGLVAVIDGDIEKGRLKLSPEKFEEYRRYTKTQRRMTDEPICKHERSIGVPGNFCWKCGREYDTPTDHHSTEGATT